MIGFVIVSHSAKLAEGVCELAGQMAQGRVPLAAAGGTSDETNPIGTDAFKVLEAINSVYSDDGVLVFTDLGSAVLSAETAIQFLEQDRQKHVRLYPGPLIEGAASAVSLAAAGATMEEILRGPEQSQGEPAAEITVTLPNALGLHARPAAQFIRMARRFDAHVTVENLTSKAGPAEAASLNGLLGLGARQGHQLRLRAHGPQASEALTELKRFIESGAGDTSAPAGTRTDQRTTGLGASAGIAIGPLIKAHPAPAAADRPAGDPAMEQQRLETALAAARKEMQELPDETGIVDAQSLFLEDPALIAVATRAIQEQHQTAEAAWQSAAAQYQHQLESLDDPYLRARAADIADIAARVLRHLTGATHEPITPAQPSILVAHDLMPSEVEQLDPNKIIGLCLETGSASAHASILVRSMGIPAVVGLGPDISALPEGTILALDGEAGRIWIDPSPDETKSLEARRQSWLEARHAAREDRLAPAITRDGRQIRVLANLNRDTEISEALANGAEGVGVLRTEFLFLDRRDPPTEDEQYAAYSRIARALGERPLVIRTLDIGGDKPVPYLDIGQEANPFLGWRGIRISLARRDLFQTQLRAIVRAAQDAHGVEVLFPMISTLDELRAAKAVLAEVVEELKANPIPVGAMIEVPSAVAVAGQLAREVTRFSIGTNDLTQYVMAADRTNARVAALADPFQPAVLKMIRDTVDAARKAGIIADLCGEMAADPRATELLIGLGLQEFSVSAPLIPDLKRAIRRTSTNSPQSA